MGAPRAAGRQAIHRAPISLSGLDEEEAEAVDSLPKSPVVNGISRNKPSRQAQSSRVRMSSRRLRSHVLISSKTCKRRASRQRTSRPSPQATAPPGLPTATI